MLRSSSLALVAANHPVFYHRARLTVVSLGYVLKLLLILLGFGVLHSGMAILRMQRRMARR